MLCAICILMFQSKDGDHHANFRDLARAADSGCKICKSICSRGDNADHVEADKLQTIPLARFEFHRQPTAKDVTARNPYIILQSKIPWLDDLWLFYLDVSCPQAAPEWWPTFLENARKDVELEPWRVREDEFPRRSITTSTGGEEVMQLAREWLWSCKCDHKTCEKMDGTRDSNFYPERLLDISNIESQTCRLIIAKNEQIIENSGYVALSHCWGSEPSFLRLTSENMKGFQQGIPLYRLAKSFRDAIHTSQQLGFHYIWIDSLCIIQSGPESVADWHTHSSTMNLIYTNCTLNLAITRAANAEEGAFTDRDPDLLQTAYVYAPAAMRFHVDNPTEKIEQETAPSASVLITIYAHLDDLPGALRSLPLQTRGWVVQERLMAPRVLHFGKDRIFWECNERVQNEYHPWCLLDARKYSGSFRSELKFSLPRAVLELSGKPLAKAEEWELHQEWLELVHDYTRTDLSFPNKDKLVAFAAVAKRFHNALSTKYIAGHFLSNLPFSLLWWQGPMRRGACQGEGWMTAHGWKETIYLDSKRDSVYRAPSWSWASLDEWIFFDVLYEKEEPQKLMANITAVTVQLVDQQNSFGQVSYADITLEGPISKIGSWHNLLEEEDYYDQVGRSETETYDDTDNFIALHVCGEERISCGTVIPYVYGLVLASRDGDTYRRMGHYHCEGPEGAKYSVEQFPRKTIKIV